MEKTLIATNVIENPGRIAGVYQAAWRVVFGDAEGVVVHTFEWDGRDIENETLMASVTVSGHVEEEIDCGGVPDRWMDCPMKLSNLENPISTTRPCSRSLDGLPDETIDNACQIIVDRFKILKDQLDN